jgi:hypothetical protein
MDALPAAGATLPPRARAEQLRSLAAPATASMSFAGPLVQETQALRGAPPTHEYQRHDYLSSGAVYARSTAERRGGASGGDLAGGQAGDGSKFSMGFFRGRSADWGGARAAADEAGCARSYARDALRQQFLAANERRTGYNVISGAEEAPALDSYKPRGRL